MTKDGKTLETAAAVSGMCENTARKYLCMGQLPSECRRPHTWRTRKDPFEDEWPRVEEMLKVNPGLEGTSILEYLERENSGKYCEGQVRTLQRRIKHWRATKGPAKEVFFEQKHTPGKSCQSDFTHMTDLGVTIRGELFQHLLYHFVLPYSNWESGAICFSENFESLSYGLQKALWELGGVPEEHVTDQLTAAVHKIKSREEFTESYQRLLRHYGMAGRYTNANKAHEKGDIEQRHHRLKRAVDQELMLCGSRDFESRQEYEIFLKMLFARLDSNRRERFQEETRELKPLPVGRLDDYKQMRAKVGPGSTIHVQHNVYSVHSRLRKEWVDVRLYAEHVEVWYGQRKVDEMPRLKGERKHRIEYRHIIDWLVRKPGAFENYRYREEMFPSTRFRMAYDFLRSRLNSRGTKEYLEILYLAARVTESGVEEALRTLMDAGQPISCEEIQKLVESRRAIPPITEVRIDKLDLGDYDRLLSPEEVKA